MKKKKALSVHNSYRLEKRKDACEEGFYIYIYNMETWVLGEEERVWWEKNNINNKGDMYG